MKSDSHIQEYLQILHEEFLRKREPFSFETGSVHINEDEYHKFIGSLYTQDLERFKAWLTLHDYRYTFETTLYDHFKIVIT